MLGRRRRRQAPLRRLQLLALGDVAQSVTLSHSSASIHTPTHTTHTVTQPPLVTLPCRWSLTPEAAAQITG